MFKKIINISSAISAALLMSTVQVQAQDVVLRTQDNAIRLTGEMLSFDGVTYELRTEIGVVQLDASVVICEGESCPVIAPSMDFAVSGAPGVAEAVLPALLSSYAAASGAEVSNQAGDGQSTYALSSEGQEAARITAAPKTSAQALQELIAGDAEVALTTRAPTDAEQQAVADAGAGPLQEHIIAVGGLVIVTPANNPLPSISIQDVARIFSGEVQNWAELGGPDLAITRYVRGADTVIAEVFDTIVLDPRGKALSADAISMESDDALSAQVASDASGIGFRRFSDAGSVRQVPIVGRCGLVVSPSAFNIQAEEYPLSYRLRAVTTGRAGSPMLEELLALLPTNAVQTALASGNLMGQNLTRSPVDQQGMRFASALQSSKVIDALPRLQAMVAEMVVSERLSATFRFESGSRALDVRGLRDVERVAQLLMDETEDGSGKTVRIIGFTDSLGDAALNQELSERRSKQVLDALLATEPALSDRVTFRPLGFGDVSPIGCDQSATGRWINRRVEIWISAATR